MKKETPQLKTRVVLPIILITSTLVVLFNFKDKIFQKSFDDNNQDSSDQKINQIDEDVDTTTFKKLSILSNRCRGCGKCSRLDPEHFEMIGAKASIISTKNLDSDALKLAINSCPAQAIVLE